MSSLPVHVLPVANRSLKIPVFTHFQQPGTSWVAFRFSPDHLNPLLPGSLRVLFVYRCPKIVSRWDIRKGMFD